MSRPAGLIRAAAWGCVGLLCILSWIPGDEMIRTGIGGHIEHGVAYMGATAIIAFAYAGRFGLAAVVTALALYAGVMELGQTFVPGRHAALEDFLASASGVASGAALFVLARRWVASRKQGKRLLAELSD
jgi:hypothetical protein